MLLLLSLGLYSLGDVPCKSFLGNLILSLISKLVGSCGTGVLVILD
jgi:hypothetical protein